MRGKIKLFSRIVLSALALFLFVTAVPVTASAEEAEKETGWQFDVELYLFAASVGGETASGGDPEVDFNDLVGDIELGFMTLLGAHKDKWSLWTDVIYLDVADSDYFGSAGTVTGTVNWTLRHEDRF